jgi:hypothetical protein
MVRFLNYGRQKNKLTAPMQMARYPHYNPNHGVTLITTIGRVLGLLATIFVAASELKDTVNANK